jgi:hypothetical protein
LTTHIVGISKQRRAENDVTLGQRFANARQ